MEFSVGRAWRLLDAEHPEHIIVYKRSTDLTNTYKNTLSECFKKSFPLVKANLSKQKSPVEPWITAAMLVSRKN